MPCDQIQYTQLDVAKFDPTIFMAALRSLDLNPLKQGAAIRFGKAGAPHVYQDGKATIQGAKTFAEELQKRIQKAYTREVISYAAKRQGFKVELDAQDGAVLRLRAGGGVQ